MGGKLPESCDVTNSWAELNYAKNTLEDKNADLVDGDILHVYRENGNNGYTEFRKIGPSWFWYDTIEGRWKDYKSHYIWQNEEKPESELDEIIEELKTNGQGAGTCAVRYKALLFLAEYIKNKL